MADPQHPQCDLCKRHVPRVTRHHLVPRSRSRKLKRRRQFERLADLPDPGETIDLCRDCHAMIHAVLSEKELESSYHTLDALLSHPQIAQFVPWAAKQSPDRRIAVRWSNDRHANRRR